MARSNSRSILYTVSKNELQKYNFNETPDSKIVSILTTKNGDEVVSTNLKLLRLPNRHEYPIDLSRVEYFGDRDAVHQGHGLLTLEKYLMKEREFLSDKSTKLKICSQRAVIMSIVTTPKCNFDWKLLAVKINGIIFLTKNDDDIGTDIRNCKFMHLCFSDSPNIRREGTFDAGIQDYGVYRHQLGNIDLLCSAEINGIISNENFEDLDDIENMNKLKFVQGKLKKKSAKPYQIERLEVRWYFQSLFANKNDIVVGIYDEDDKIEEPIKVITINDLKVPQTKNYLGFLHKILNKINDVMTEGDDSIYEFSYNRNSHSIIYGKHSDNDKKYKFLTDEFIESLEI